MDLRHFHPNDGKNYNHKVTDRRNNRSGYFACHFLEWIGWYNINIAQRLLGHYRLFQLYKLKNRDDRTELVPARAYILQYRETRYLKPMFGHVIAFLQPIVEFGKTDRNIEIHSINRMLLKERMDVLEKFLTDAEQDFDQAFLAARERILDPQFLYAPTANPPIRQFSVQINENHQHNINLSKNELHFHPAVQNHTAPESQPKGKEKDIFSKKQMLLFFDLLTSNKKIESIDFRKPAKFKAIAHLLRAVTGRSEDTWKAELEDYRNKSLYDWHTDGERQELIRILDNLAKKFENAGFISIAQLAEKKIKELDSAHR